MQLYTPAWKQWHNQCLYRKGDISDEFRERRMGAPEFMADRIIMFVNYVASNTSSLNLLLSDSQAGPEAQSLDHAVIGGVVAVVVFAMLCLLIVLGRYFARHKGNSAPRLSCGTFSRSIDFLIIWKKILDWRRSHPAAEALQVLWIGPWLRPH